MIAQKELNERSRYLWGKVLASSDVDFVLLRGQESSIPKDSLGVYPMGKDRSVWHRNSRSYRHGIRKDRWEWLRGLAQPKQLFLAILECYLDGKGEGCVWSGALLWGPFVRLGTPLPGDTGTLLADSYVFRRGHFHVLGQLTENEVQKGCGRSRYQSLGDSLARLLAPSSLEKAGRDLFGLEW